MQPDFIYGLTPGDIIYDIETFPNAFTLRATHAVSKTQWCFEISDRKDELNQLILFITTANQMRCRMVGFNNLGFDYPVLHQILNRIATTAPQIYKVAMSIINAPFNARFAHVIWDKDQLIPQVDLFKIHHFDNPAKSTSLKILECHMRMDSVEDLPFPVGTHLTSEQIDTLIEYNGHDVDATLMFYERSSHAIALREKLSDRFGRNMTNMNDIKIGETILISEMEAHGISCYTQGRQKKQTIHGSLGLSTVIFPYVHLENPEFNRIHQWLAAQTITETKGVFTDLVAEVQGLEYKIGTGGLHASMHQSIIESSETHQLVDVDVASYYPNMGIHNELFPAHLGREFCDAYLSMYETRKTHKKGSPENAAYKLGLVGAYGGSNNKYSPFFDMAYTMSITINGQLLLLMLVEQMLKIPGLTMVQCNTDGITYLCPREYLGHSRAICKWWEGVTKLELEKVPYNRMMIRDVNSYIAEYEDGKLKRIGAYAYVTAEEDPGTRELPWHKDWSSRVVAKAAEAALVRGEDIREFITSHKDIHDFMLRTKVPRSSMLEHGGVKVGNIIRYYISTDGDILEKFSPPTGIEGHFKKGAQCSKAVYEANDNSVWSADLHTKNQSRHEERRTGIHTGYTVRICNRMDEFTDTINYEYYINEAEKLVLPLRS